MHNTHRPFTIPLPTNGPDTQPIMSSAVVVVETKRP
jgi:hypothetical protein